MKLLARAWRCGPKVCSGHTNIAVFQRSLFFGRLLFRTVCLCTVQREPMKGIAVECVSKWRSDDSRVPDAQVS